jgi:hypothetical protein
MSATFSFERPATRVPLASKTAARSPGRVRYGVSRSSGAHKLVSACSSFSKVTSLAEVRSRGRATKGDTAILDMR